MMPVSQSPMGAGGGVYPGYPLPPPGPSNAQQQQQQQQGGYGIPPQPYGVPYPPGYMMQLPPTTAGGGGQTPNIAGGSNGGGGGGGQTTMTTVYSTQYAGVTVLEAMVRNVAIMMRRDDQWVNASQILKVSGVGKAERARLIDNELTPGTPHENVSAKGFGKYQGVWVPLATGMELAHKYSVGPLLAPVFGLQQQAALSMPPPPGAMAIQPPPPPQQQSGAGSPPGDSGKQQSRHTKQASSSQGPRPPSSSTAQAQQQPQSQPPSAGLSSPFTNTALPAPSQRYPMQQQQEQQQQQQQQQPMYLPPPPPDPHQGGYYHPQPPQLPQQQQQPPVQGAYGSMAPPPATNAASKRGLEEEMPPLGAMQGDGSAPPPHKRSRLSIAEPEGAVVGLGTDGGDISMDSSGGGGVFDDMADYSRVAPPAGTRLANKPSRPLALSASAAAAGQNNNDDDDDENAAALIEEASPSAARISVRGRQRLMAILEATEEEDVDLDAFIAPGPSSPSKSSPNHTTRTDDFDIDQIIDDKGHSALHWATSLARIKLVDQLIARGADVHRGNFAGETPLVRAALTNNHADRGTFADLLERHLGPTLRTVDKSHKTVLHHIANVAGVKGRAASANVYLTAVLSYLAQHESEQELREFVNIQDMAGDTALNVAARVGNATHIKLLLEAGADKNKANLMGLRPADFGVALEDLGTANGNGVARPPLVRARSSATKKCEGVMQRLTETLSGLQNDFSVELGEKTDTLEKTQKDVIAATRDLAAIRQQLKVARESHNDHQAVQQKLSNLKRQLVQEQAYDWVQQQATGSESVDLADGSEFTLPDDAEVPYLRTVLDWQRYTAETVQKKRKEDDLQREASLKRFRKVMALVLKIAEDQVEMNMLGQLASTVEDATGPEEKSKISDLVDRIATGTVNSS